MARGRTGSGGRTTHLHPGVSSGGKRAFARAAKPQAARFGGPQAPLGAAPGTARKRHGGEDGRGHRRPLDAAAQGCRPRGCACQAASLRGVTGIDRDQGIPERRPVFQEKGHHPTRAKDGLACARNGAGSGPGELLVQPSGTEGLNAGPVETEGWQRVR